eukprot:TRINITY_DN7500_c0_g2_i1.p1 TRINITY_DN7500_c0_g2~~TRINITY_DN7500_c0_g2_i1.p1  ORF type:complete len:317 (-),score=40.98 TRINITY_DN7500_c0_g2_i1:228-1178(-)
MVLVRDPACRAGDPRLRLAVLLVLQQIPQYSVLLSRFGWTQILFLWAPHWTGPLLTMSWWEVHTGALHRQDPEVYKHPATGGYAKDLRSGANNAGVALLYDFVSASEAEEVKALLGTSLTEQYSGAGEASLSRTESSFADSFVEWAYSFIRISSGSWIPEGSEAVTNRISERIEKLTGLPDKNCERFYLIKYLPGQQFRAHHDLYDMDPTLPFPVHANSRAVTVLIYLSDVDSGGTVFPLAVPPLEVRAKRGNALVWRNCINGTVPPGSDKDVQCVARDWRSIHAGLPVVEGAKFTMTRWCHEGVFSSDEPPSDHG